MQIVDDSRLEIRYHSNLLNQEIHNSVGTKTSLPKPLTAGLFGWALGSLLLFAAAWPIIHPEAASIAGIWAVSHWWIAFVSGAVVLVIQGMLSRQTVGAALLAYLLPAGIPAAVCGTCIAIHPDSSFRDDLLNSLALVLLFQAIGVLWILFPRGDRGKSPLVRAIVPAIIGGLIVLSLIAVPVFRSNAFTYQNAFALSVTKTSLENRALLADGVLEIRKPGNHGFTAPRFFVSVDLPPGDFSGDGLIEPGKITWENAGPPADGATGSYPFQIHWVKSVPVSQTALDASEEMDHPNYLQVRDSKEPTGNLLYQIHASTPAIAR